MQDSLGNIAIFWDESAIYVLLYAVYALVVCTATLVYEKSRQRGAGTGVAGLLVCNAVPALLASALFAASLLASGWYADYLGGEIGAFILSLAVSALVLYLGKTYVIARYAVAYRSRRVAAIVLTAILLAPYTLFSIFIFLLASGFRN
jgi:hypothetical protein